VRPSQDVSLNREGRTFDVSFPFVCSGPGINGYSAFRIDDRHLPTLFPFERIFSKQSIEHLLRIQALSKQLQTARSVSSVHRCLSRNRSNARLRPRDMIPHSEDARGDGHTKVARCRIDGDDRKRGKCRARKKHD